MNYTNYTTAELRKKAGIAFRKWIRKRDKGQPCISCGHPTFSDAGHFYPVGTYPALEFDEDNVHGQCRSCNYFKSGNLLDYRRNLVHKIGEYRLEALDYKAGVSKRTTHKHNRLYLIEIIEKYK